MINCLKVCVPVLLLALPAVSSATTIFTNFGTGFSYNKSEGNFIGNGQDGSGINYAEGDTFTPSVTSTFGTLEIALGCFSAISCPASFNVSLDSDNVDQPGATLESFTVSALTLGVFGANNPPLVLTSVLRSTLLAGTRYWIAVSSPATDSIVWGQNSTGDLSEEAISTDGAATWFVPSGLTPGAFEVDSPSPVVAPEPGALMLAFGAGLILIIEQKLRSGLRLDPQRDSEIAQ